MGKTFPEQRNLEQRGSRHLTDAIPNSGREIPLQQREG